MVRFWQPYGTGLAIHVQGMLKQCYKKQEQHFLHNSESLCLFLIFLSKPNTEYLINVVDVHVSVCRSVDMGVRPSVHQETYLSIGLLDYVETLK